MSITRHQDREITKATPEKAIIRLFADATTASPIIGVTMI